MSTPAAEVEIDETLIRRLLREQHPDLAEQSIEIQDSGWDNVMARLGEDLAVRLPRREIAAELLRNEQRWLPRLAPGLPLPVPAPKRVGTPTAAYPFPWSVLGWLPGTTADLEPPDVDQAEVLADFLRAVHQPAPADAPRNPHRDRPLSSKDEAHRDRLKKLEERGEAVPPLVDELWARALASPIDVPKTWIAGDIHARNVLVQNGKISAFIDWGDLCEGDRATDLASIWALFSDAEARRCALERYAPTPSTLDRARGWAAFYGVILLQTGLEDFPAHVPMARKVLAGLEKGE